MLSFEDLSGYSNMSILCLVLGSGCSSMSILFLVLGTILLRNAGPNFYGPDKGY